MQAKEYLYVYILFFEWKWMKIENSYIWVKAGESARFGRDGNYPLYREAHHSHHLLACKTTSLISFHLSYARAFFLSLVFLLTLSPEACSGFPNRFGANFVGARSARNFDFDIMIKVLLLYFLGITWFCPLLQECKTQILITFSSPLLWSQIENYFRFSFKKI